jgi:hypothetical protein
MTMMIETVGIFAFSWVGLGLFVYGFLKHRKHGRCTCTKLH